MQPEELFAVVFALVVLSGVFIVIMGLRQRSHQLEMLHRERMAMIERGMVPAPETVMTGGHRPVGAAGARSLSLGIVIVAAGLGLMTLIGVAFGEAEVGVGVGGAVAILGAAFIVRAQVVRPAASMPTRPDGPGDGTAA
jgi:hypothetical protein